MKRLVPLALAALLAVPALAAAPGEQLPDPVQERRARALGTELRCLVCQNQSIDDSDASLARDLRLLVRERITAGDNDQQIRDFLVARYGEFVLLRPRLTAQTLLLWSLPALALGFGGFAAWRLFGRRGEEAVAAAAPEVLSADEQAALDAILKPKDKG
jgi:cytochrome c-type biogenesis protein CcmH